MSERDAAKLAALERRVAKLEAWVSAVKASQKKSLPVFKAIRRSLDKSAAKLIDAEKLRAYILRAYDLTPRDAPRSG